MDFNPLLKELFGVFSSLYFMALVLTGLLIGALGSPFALYLGIAGVFVYVGSSYLAWKYPTRE